jgi:hypothetical protein
MNAYGVAGVYIHVFLIGGEWSVSRSGRFTQGEKDASAQWTGG